MASDRETQQARIDLAAAFRLAARLGLNEGICNHFSMRLPGTHDRFLINAYGLHWSEISASNLIVVNDEGAKIEGEGEVELTAITLHTGIHKANAGAACVLHTHMPHATALACLENGRLEPLSLSGYASIIRSDTTTISPAPPPMRTKARAPPPSSATNPFSSWPTTASW